jgi:hypothetical protein
VEHIAAVSGVVKRLRELLGDQTGSYVGYRPTLKPPPAAGQWYVAVGQDSCVANGKYGSAYYEKRHTVAICLTWKLGYAPDDRLASLIMANSWMAQMSPEIAAEGRPALVEVPEVQSGIMAMAELVMDLLIEDYETVKAMNYFLGTDKSDDVQTLLTPPQTDWWWGFSEPFHSGTIGPVSPQDASWVGGIQGTGGGSDVQTVMVTVAGAASIRPARYPRGLDLENFTSNY